MPRCEKVRSLVPGMGGDQSLVVVSLALGIGVGTGLQAEDHQLLAFRSLVRQGGSEELAGVVTPEVLGQGGA